MSLKHGSLFQGLDQNFVGTVPNFIWLFITLWKEEQKYGVVCAEGVLYTNLSSFKKSTKERFTKSLSRLPLAKSYLFLFKNLIEADFSKIESFLNLSNSNLKIKLITKFKETSFEIFLAVNISGRYTGGKKDLTYCILAVFEHSSLESFSKKDSHILNRLNQAS
ncbi:hypothetical protein BY458DRAFT_494077 [Sporodiniella umbellata]|nr:hypothetical protein BY458DRAFT_494077 [Sporodiniella umbellata]